jgi:hypothetical protein
MATRPTSAYDTMSTCVHTTCNIFANGMIAVGLGFIPFFSQDQRRDIHEGIGRFNQEVWMPYVITPIENNHLRPMFERITGQNQ